MGVVFYTCKNVESQKVLEQKRYKLEDTVQRLREFLPNLIVFVLIKPSRKHPPNQASTQNGTIDGDTMLLFC